jgi:cytochrome P450
MRDFALRLPVQVIGMLVGVPKADQADLRKAEGIANRARCADRNNEEVGG